MAQIDLKHATLTIKDGAGHSLYVKIGEGNLTYTENREIQYVPDRGVLDEVREGDQQPMDVNFDFVWEYLKGPSSGSSAGGVPTIEDALKKRGGAADWTSSDEDHCRPYAVDLVVEYIPDCLPGDKEVITLPDFRHEQLTHDLRAGTISATGKCNATEAIPVRSAIVT